MLSEKKIVKLIELMEEQQPDNLMLPSRVDRKTEKMATASDPRASLEQLEVSERNNNRSAAAAISTSGLFR